MSRTLHTGGINNHRRQQASHNALMCRVAGSRGVRIVADQLISDAVKQQYDLIACPGGMPGAERLRDSEALEQIIKQQQASGRLYAAICATPAVFFKSKGILQDQKATTHPAFADKLSNQDAVAERVVVDGKLTTSRGPGTAFEFALSLVKQLYGEKKLEEIAGPMVMYDYKV
eukprot:GHRR01013065.1.p1 GENE.GHRR01013065.1~~GHRR01013065.1.p1  ORF type:complete len:173 (+),score=38.00 GHRR01013065.1:565-1083(+)